MSASAISHLFGDEAAPFPFFGEARSAQSTDPAREKEAALVKRFQSGDEDSLKGIIREHQGPIFSYIYRQVRDETEAADILSQTFVKAWRSRDRYKPRAKFKTWLFKIASNLCHDWGRRRKRHPADFAAMQTDIETLNEAQTEQLTDESNSADQTMLREESQLLRVAIDELPRDLREAIALCHLEGHSHREAGQLLGCSLKTVEMRLYRARQRLKVTLQGKLGDNPDSGRTGRI
ncbi:MAG: RNA polymerase sigma factor (sigma-70 family) [Verrucomicrobiales bacterium]|jgi:RNA polymerase sigma factor (sigma-70 family)